MKILFLGYDTNFIAEHLRQDGCEVFEVGQKVIDLHYLKDLKPDLIISYGYRHKLDPVLCQSWAFKIVNLHISYLPYGKGANPTLWSVIMGEPSGVTIHYIDAGLDTGPIIAQARVELQEEMTLQKAKEECHACIQDLFTKVWVPLKEELQRGERRSTPQDPKAGSYHELASLERTLNKKTLKEIREFFSEQKQR